jgi:iron complex outermembrane receptor protein
LFLIGLVTIGAPALAADDSPGEIVVTVQRRAERLQDVPEAITAPSGDALNALHWQGAPGP